MEKKPDVEVVTVSRHITKDHPAAVRELNEIVKVGARRLHLVIRTSSYPTNTRVDVSVWTSEGWKYVHHIPHDHVRSRPNPYADLTVDDFYADRKELLRVVLEVISEQP